MDDALGTRETTKTPLPPLLPGVLDDPSRRLTRKLPVSHAFIVSAYYYPKSKSLGTNAVAVNMVVDSRNFKIEQSTFYVVGSNETHAQLTVANSQM
uniref:Dirigent protein n=1 Tax=Caenorhabditis tropicalis TaxID=1561998 RepID=A0A1I7TW30_9PELO